MSNISGCLHTLSNLVSHIFKFLFIGETVCFEQRKTTFDSFLRYFLVFIYQDLLVVICKMNSKIYAYVGDISLCEGTFRKIFGICALSEGYLNSIQYSTTDCSLIKQKTL